MAVSFLADECLPRAIVRGVKRRDRSVDFVRVQDIGLAGNSDPEILEWAADDGRVVVSRDKATMSDFAGERIVAGHPMPGLLLVPENYLPLLRELIDDLLLVSEDDPKDWEHRIEYLPI